MMRTLLPLSLVALAATGLTLSWLLEEAPPAPARAPRPRAEAPAPAPRLPEPLPAARMVSLDLPVAELAAALGARARRQQEAYGKAREALEQARAGALSATDLRGAFERLGRQGHAEGIAALLVGELGAEPRYAFAAALALGAFPEAAVCSRLFHALESAPAELRPTLLFALRGATDTRTEGRIADFYLDGAEDPAVRATAAFHLASPGRLQRLGERAEEVVERARADLLGAEPAAFSGAADVLAAADLPEGEQVWLREVARHDPSPARRMEALRVLAGSVDESRLREELAASFPELAAELPPPGQSLPALD